MELGIILLSDHVLVLLESDTNISNAQYPDASLLDEVDSEFGFKK